MKNTFLTLVGLMFLFSCNKTDEGQDISYSFIGHTWNASKENIEIVHFDNLLSIKLQGKNKKETYADLHLTVVDPAEGLFEINGSTKHAFSYSHTAFSFDPIAYNRTDFTYLNRKCNIQITKLDYVNRLVSFRFETVLDGGDIKESALKIEAENMPMEVFSRHAGYAKYKLDDMYHIAVDTTIENTSGTYYGVGELGGPFVYCTSSEQIFRSQYTQNDTSLTFFAGQLSAIHQTMKEYNLELFDAENERVRGRFDAKYFHTDFPENVYFLKDGYFEAYAK